MNNETGCIANNKLKYKKKPWLSAISYWLLAIGNRLFIRRTPPAHYSFLISRFSLLAFLCSSCVDKIEIDYNLNSNILTVEGQVSDQIPTTIQLSNSRTSGRSVYNEPIKNAVVEILVGDGSKLNLTESPAGSYNAPNAFRGVEGQTYQLRFKMTNGAVYQSSIEKVTKSPEIKKLYHSFNQSGILDANGKRVLGSSFDVFLDLDDPADKRNYYLWKWQLYERQNVCITCEQGYLNSFSFQCTKVNLRPPAVYPTYDYECSGQCWEILYNSDINILSDIFTNGKSIVGRRVAQVPFYSDQGCLIEVQQYAVSSEAYQYYSLLRDISQTTGTLTDTPPATAVGNIQNLANSSERVIGYFGAVSSKNIRYWIDRSGYGSKGVRSSLLGHDINLEPSTPPTPPLNEIRPPLYPCSASRFRTPIKPEGWR